MIKSFSDKETEKVFNGVVSRKLPGDMQNTARRKLKYLNNAQSPDALRQPLETTLRPFQAAMATTA